MNKAPVTVYVFCYIKFRLKPNLELIVLNILCVCVCGGEDSSRFMILNQFLNLAVATDMMRTERPWTPTFPDSLGNLGMAFQMTSTLPLVSMALVNMHISAKTSSF